MENCFIVMDNQVEYFNQAGNIISCFIISRESGFISNTLINFIGMKRKHLVTIKDIAADLKISVSTVSRAFRNTFDVSKETRDAVLAKGEELNYKPNLNARGLVNYKSRNIAVILPTITNFYFSTAISGIQDVAYENGFNIIFYVTGESTERELHIAQSLSLSSIDGLLVSITSESEKCDHFSKIIDYGLPIVFFDRVSDSLITSKVTQNDYEGAFTAVEHLVKQGYRRIAYIGGPLSLVFSRERLRGYLAALKRYGLPVEQSLIIHSDFNQASGGADAEKLLGYGENKPDAIFAVNDRKAIGAMLKMKERGIKIGKEIGVIGFTNDPMAGIISPGLTTMEEPALEVGKQSCELLLKHISKKNFQPKSIILSGKLIVRESTVR